MDESKSNNQVVKFWPDLMTESELVEYLRIAEVSKAGNFKHVVANLKRMRDLPCLHLCRQPLYWLPAIRKWLQEQVEKERSK